MTGTRGRGTGTQERRDEPPERRDEPPERRKGERETLWTRPNRVLGPGNEYPPCVDMAGTSDPLSRCVIIGNCPENDVISHRKSRDVLINQSNV